MNRFFVEQLNVDLSKHSIVITDKDDIKHMIKVLRLEINDNVEVCDQNSEYLCSIECIDSNEIRLKIDEKLSIQRELQVQIDLFQGLPKSSKMEVIVQKNVEIGVTDFYPVIFNRCIVKLSDKNKEDKKVERWQKIAQEAAKQSKRTKLSKVHNILTTKSLNELLGNYDIVLLAYEKETSKLSDLEKEIKNSKKVAIIIGPEGGFEEAEVDELIKNGAKTISLGTRILRTETAGMTLSSIISYIVES